MMMMMMMVKMIMTTTTMMMMMIIIIIIIIAISGGIYLIKKEAENILKYKDLTIEIYRMWNVRTKVTPVK